MKHHSLSKLLGGTSSTNYNPAQFTHILAFKPSPQDSKTTLVERVDPQSGYKTPLFSVRTSYSKPQFQLSRIMGQAHPGHPQIAIIGDAVFHTFSSTADITLHGQQFHIKKSQSQMSLSGGYGFSCPPMGKLKWESANGGLGLSSAIELTDTNTGQKLARFGRDKSVSRLSGMKSGEKRLEIMVPCGGFFIDVAVLTALTASKMKSKEDEEGAEVAEAVAGV